MALKGDLASVDLAQVFQMLALNQKVGMLCIQSPRAWKALYFEPRGACLFFNEHVLLDNVLLQLARTGQIAEESAMEARDHAAKQNAPLADVLLAGGYLTETELENALGTQMEEEIYDLFFWRDAHFEFFEGATTIEGREGRTDPRFFFSPDSLIMEAARRIDEWSYIQERVSGPLEIHRPVKNSPEILRLDDSALALLDLVDGKRNVSRLVEITGMPPFLVYKGVAQMLDARVVEIVPPRDLIPTARQCVAERRFQDAINLYERAISFGEGVPETNAEVAGVYESCQEFELAAYHHKCVAEFHAGAGDVRKAAEILQHVVAMLPTDLAARERLVEVAVGRPDLASKDLDPVAIGKQLVDLYLEIGEVERVRGILERLLRDNPYDVELKKSLINVHTKAGDTRRVIELYESIAEDLVQARKPIEAVKYLQKILMLDRARKDVSERIRSLYVMDERRRSRRRSMVVMFAMGIVLLVLGGVYYTYEQHAREHLAKIEGVVDSLIAAKDYAHARSQYESFVRQYPLTMVSREVEGELARIESLRLVHEADLVRERRERQQELDKLRQSYRLAWTVYRGHVDEKNLDKALEQLDAVARMVDKAGEPEDRKWAVEQNLDQNRRELTAYMARALALDRQAWAKLDAGDWRAARALWLEVLSDYWMSQTARNARLPVLVRSRPTGAAIFYRGAPLLGSGKSAGTQQTTPCVVMCDPAEPEPFELHRPGCEPARLTVDARTTETVDHVLTVVPSGRFVFEAPARGVASAGRGLVGVSLRGGRIGIANLSSGATFAVVKLPGLDELEGTVAFTNDSAIFVTKEGYVASHSLHDGNSRWGRRIQIKFQPVHDIILHNGRVLFVDTEGRMLALDANQGTTLWFTPIEGVASGRPVVHDRVVHVGQRAGGVLTIDASNGRILKRTSTPSGIVVGPVFRNGALVVGLDDGRIAAILESTGEVVWTQSVGEKGAVTALEVAGESVLAVDSQRRLSKIGLRDGQIEAVLPLSGALVSGPRVADRRAFVTLRERQQKGVETDVLQAIDLQDLSVAWEYRDGGQFAAGVSTSGSDVFLPDSKGEVLLFR
jgi:outer membrane protein assembly factor BamB/tetratricopeptide (TPR) repeat protein